MRCKNPFCDICEQYCETEWVELPYTYRYNYHGLKRKEKRITLLCCKCERHLHEIIKAKSEED